MVLSSPVSWAPEVRPSSRETAPEKKSPGTALRPGWEMQFTGGKASEPPAGKKRPYCSWTIRLQECVRPHLCLTGLSSVFPLQCNQDWKGDGVDFPGASWGTAGLSVHTATPSRWDQLTGLHLSVSERGSLVAVVGDSGRASGGTLTPHGACVQERSSVRFSPG